MDLNMLAYEGLLFQILTKS